MDYTSWDTNAIGGGGGGITQQLKLSGQTLSLIPSGGSVQLPTAYVSSTTTTLQVSSLVAHDSIFLLNNGIPAIKLTSTGNIYLSTAFGTVANFNFVNASSTMTTYINASNATLSNATINTGNISTILTSKITATNAYVNYEEVTTLYAGNSYTSNSWANKAFFGCNYMRIQDEQGATTIFQPNNSLTMNTTMTMGTTSVLNTNNINVQGQITMNSNSSSSNVLSNDNSNLIFNGQIIVPGPRGDASQWANYPANHFIDANNNGIGGINGLWVNQGDVSLLNGFIGTSAHPATFTVGSTYIHEDFATQPNVIIGGKDVQISAGAAILPAYNDGRSINLDAYPGIYTFSSSRDSQINLTAHGNTTIPLNVLAAPGRGIINLTAYNSVSQYSPFNPFSYPGIINVNASIINIGNNNSTPLFGTTKITHQAYSMLFIAGSIIIPTSLIGPAITYRSGGGVEYLTDITNSQKNTDSVIRVKEIIAQNNADFNPILPDPFGEYLTLDGRSGGITLNNFRTANGQGAGASLLNVASLTGSYADGVANNIKSSIDYTTSTASGLQSQINAIVSGGGQNLSNIANWYQFPAISTISLNKSIAMNATNASISTLSGLSITDFAGNLQPIKASQLQINGNPIIYTNNAYSFTSASGAVAPLIVSSIAFNPQGTSYNLGTVGNSLYFNGQKVATNMVIPSNISTFSNLNAVSFNSDQPLSTLTIYSAVNGLSTINAPAFGLNANTSNYVNITSDSNGSLDFTIYKNNALFTKPISADWDNTNSKFQLQLSNVSTINGMPYGNGSVSSIGNWSYFPVTNSNITYGNQSIWLKGEGNLKITNQAGTQPLPISAQQLDVYNPSYGGLRATFGQDIDGMAAVLNTGASVGLRVSTLSLASNVLSATSTNLLINGINPVSNWASYIATVPINTTNSITLSNSATAATTLLNIQGADSVMTATGNIYLKGISTIAYNTLSVLSGSLNAMTLNTSSININNTVISGSNGNLLVNNVVINTSTSITNWASYDASQIVNSPYGYKSASLNSNILYALSASNTMGKMNVSVDAAGNTSIYANQLINVMSSNCVVYNKLTMNGGTSYIDNTSINAINTTTSNLTLGVNVMNSASGDSNIYVNGNPLAYQISYSKVFLGSYGNNNYTSAGNYDVPTGFSNFQPLYNYGILSVQVIFPATLVQNNSNYFIFGLQRIGFANSIFTNAVLPVSGGASTFAPNLELFCDFSSYIGSNYGFRFKSNIAGAFTFYNAQIKYLPN